MSELRVPRHLLLEMHEHAEAIYPEECCGVMIGATDGPGTFVLDRLVKADNEREDEARHNRFLIEPITILKAQKAAREAGLDIIGYYHSHPDHPSEPSDFDREHAWPQLSYVIVSVRQGKVATEQSWRLTDDRSRFEEESISVEETT